MIDDTAAEVVRKIYRFCIEGFDPVQIARILTEQGIPNLPLMLCRKAEIMDGTMPNCIAGERILSATFLKDLNIAVIRSIFVLT